MNLAFRMTSLWRMSSYVVWDITQSSSSPIVNVCIPHSFNSNLNHLYHMLKFWKKCLQQFSYGAYTPSKNPFSLKLLRDFFWQHICWPLELTVCIILTSQLVFYILYFHVYVLEMLLHCKLILFLNFIIQEITWIFFFHPKKGASIVLHTKVRGIELPYLYPIHSCLPRGCYNKQKSFSLWWMHKA